MSRRIAGEILELLKAEGPLLAKDVRTKLMVSSQTAFDAAVYVLREEHQIDTERVAQWGGAQFLRLVGDERPLPESMTAVIERTTYPKRRRQTLTFGSR